MIGQAALARTDGLTRVVAALVLMTAFAGLIALSARVVVPLWFTPVGITLQVMAVALTGMLLGSRLGTAAVVQYYLAGLAGLPVFLGGAFGPVYAAGPTGGYLVGFIAMAFVTGWIVERQPNPGRLVAFVAALAGLAVLYVFGAGWLAVWYNTVQAEGLATALGLAFVNGVAAFIAVDLAKVVVAALVFQGGREIVSLLRR